MCRQLNQFDYNKQTKRKVLFTPAQVSIVTLLATPLLGAGLIAYNYFCLKKLRELLLFLILGSLVLLMYLLLTLQFLEWVPAPFHLVASALIAYIVAEKLQGSVFLDRAQEGISIASITHIMVLCLLTWMTIFIADSFFRF